MHVYKEDALLTRSTEKKEIALLTYWVWGIFHSFPFLSLWSSVGNPLPHPYE